MKKGIAIHYILILVIGVLVMGIIVYFAYRYLTGSEPLTESQCRARIISYCTGCYNSRNPSTGAWSGGPQMGNLLADCQQYGLLGCAVNSNCGSTCGAAGTVKNICRGYIPVD